MPVCIIMYMYIVIIIFGKIVLAHLRMLAASYIAIIGERSEPPCLLNYPNFRYIRRAERAPHLSYSGEKSSSYIYICFLYIYIYIYTFVRRARARYAQTSDRPVEVQRSI